MQNGKRFLREGKLTDARNAFTKCINITPEMALSVMEVKLLSRSEIGGSI